VTSPPPPPPRRSWAWTTPCQTGSPRACGARCRRCARWTTTPPCRTTLWGAARGGGSGWSWSGRVSGRDGWRSARGRFCLGLWGGGLRVARLRWVRRRQRALLTQRPSRTAFPTARRPAEDEPLPGDWKRMPEFERLLLFRALRPDRLTAAMKKFVTNVIGAKWAAGRGAHALAAVFGGTPRNAAPKPVAMLDPALVLSSEPLLARNHQVRHRSTLRPRPQPSGRKAWHPHLGPPFPRRGCGEAAVLVALFGCPNLPMPAAEPAQAQRTGAGTGLMPSPPRPPPKVHLRTPSQTIPPSPTPGRQRRGSWRAPGLHRRGRPLRFRRAGPGPGANRHGHA
jgi:hypothetical protein